MSGYLICATPRSGSTLLCGVLKATGVAGFPESYFRPPNELEWARRLGVLDESGTVDYRAFVSAALAVGSTPNGVYAARVMWGTLDHVVARLDPSAKGNPAAELRVVNEAFGHPRFVHLWREDVVAQAVSWLRAEQTGFWHDGEPLREGGGPPAYDGPRLHAFVRMVREHNAGWRSWFESAGVRAYAVKYEDLVTEMDGSIRELFDFLGIPIPPGHRIVPRHRRQADALNADWIARYRAEFARSESAPPEAGQPGPFPNA